MQLAMNQSRYCWSSAATTAIYLMSCAIPVSYSKIHELPISSVISYSVEIDDESIGPEDLRKKWCVN